MKIFFILFSLIFLVQCNHDFEKNYEVIKTGNSQRLGMLTGTNCEGKAAYQESEISPLLLKDSNGKELLGVKMSIITDDHFMCDARLEENYAYTKLKIIFRNGKEVILYSFRNYDTEKSDAFGKSRITEALFAFEDKKILELPISSITVFDESKDLVSQPLYTPNEINTISDFLSAYFLVRLMAFFREEGEYQEVVCDNQRIPFRSSTNLRNKFCEFVQEKNLDCYCDISNIIPIYDADKNLVDQLKESLNVSFEGNADVAIKYIYHDVFVHLMQKYELEGGIDEAKELMIQSIDKFKGLLKENDKPYKFEVGEITKRVSFGNDLIYKVILKVISEQETGIVTSEDEVVAISNNRGKNWTFIQLNFEDTNPVVEILKLKYPNETISKIVKN